MKYVLLGIWMKIRNENPMFIRDNTVFRIGKEVFQLNFEKENLDILLEWLTRIELGKLYDYFRSQEKTSLETIQNLTEEEIKKVK